MPEELKPVNLPGRPRNIVPLDNSGPAQLTGSLAYRQSKDTLESLFASVPIDTGAKQSTVYQSEVDDLLTGRYNNVIYGANNEDIHGRNQSFLDKAVNGTLKGVGLAATTFAGGLGTVYGIGKSFFSGKLSDVWQNEISESLDEINKEIDNRYLPNYYTDNEKNAAWYSPDNLFTANFLFDKLVKNTGFAVGAIYSGNLAAKGIGVIGKGVGGMFDKVGKYTEAWKSFSNLNKGAARLFSQGKNIEAAEILQKEIKSVYDIEKAATELKKVSDQFLRVEGVQDFTRRSIMSLYSSAGESSFESIGTATAFREKKIQEYRDTWGFDPTGQDLEKIDKLSKDVGNASFMANMAVLSVTEFTQLPYLLGSSYKPNKAVANAFKSTDDVMLEGGKFVAKPTSRLSKASRFVKSYIFDPKESAQEFLQTSIDVGVQDYYNKAYEGNETDDLLDAFANAGSSAATAFKESITSKEGGESILLGGLSGGLMQAKGKYGENKLRDKNTKQFLAELNTPDNTFTKAFIERTNSLQRGIKLQEESEQFVREGNKSGFLDNKHDQSYNYISTRVKYGRAEMIYDDINERRKQASTEDGYKNLQANGGAPTNLSREDYLKKLNEFENHVGEVSSLYESANIRYGGRLDAEGNRIYSDEVIDKMVYASSKINDYDKRLMELGGDISATGIDNMSINEVLRQSASWEAGDLETAVKEEAVVSAISKAVSSINSLDVADAVKDQMKEDFSDYLDMSLRRKTILQELNDIMKSPEKYKEEQAEVLPDKEITPTVKIKTRDGVKDYETGVEYFLGSVVEYDKDGNEVYKFPRLTIIGENSDGTIKIKDSSGKIRDVSKEVLASYKLGKVSSVETNENANFYLRNINNVVYWNTGKAKKGKVAGRLTYDSENDDLYFTYKDSKGKIQSVQVSLDSFKPKEGFDEGIFSFGRTLTAADQADIQNREESGKTTQDINKKRGARLEIINNLFNNLTEKFDKTSRLIQQKYTEFERITNELVAIENKIKAGEVTKKSNFKKVTANAIKAANRLSRMQEQLRLEIQELEAQRDEIEFTQSYLMDLAQNIDELPTDSREFLNEIKEQVSSLESLILSTGENINALSKIIDNTESALEKALDLVRDLIKKFESTYPNVPTIMGQEWVDFLKANPNFLKLNPNFKEDLATVEDIVAQVEDLDIVPNERTVSELRESLETIQGQLSEYEKELKAKSVILDAFEETVKKYEEQKEQERLLLKTKEIMSEILGTEYKGVQTQEFSKTYEPESKKETSILPRATAASQGKPHHDRANKFGVNLPKLKESLRNKIRGVYITASNEDQLIPGLIDHLRKNEEGVIDESIPRDQVIALVMVSLNDDGSFELVDTNGEPLKAGDNKLDSAIYQTYPTEKLEWDAKWSKSGKAESMFRKDTPAEVVNQVKEQYAAWRKATLAKSTLELHKVDASFGIAQNVKLTDSEGNTKTNFDATTSVVDAGLVTEDQLERDPVLKIPTTNDTASEGTVSFKTPLGRVFLRIPGIGLVKLKNRKLTKNEASTVYEAIYKLSKNMVDPEKGLKSEESKLLVSWLKSIIYWGTPKERPGYNSIWFDFDENSQRWMLNMSGKGKDFPFTPSSIRDNKDQILMILENMYNNVNSTLATGKDYWNKPYYEIVGFAEDGSPITRTVDGKPYWPNYQTYLLSQKGRKAEELPLSTIMRPLTSEDDVNREGVYFYTTDNADEFVITAPKKAATSAVVTPGAPKAQTATPTPTPSGDKFDLSGSSKNKMNIVDSKGTDYGSVEFSINGEEFVTTGGAKGFTPTFTGETVAALAKAKNISEDEARANIAKYVIVKLTPQLQEIQNKINKKEEPTPAPAQPAAPTDAKVIGVEYVLENKEVAIDSPSGEISTPLIDYGAASKESYEGTKVKVLSATDNTVEVEVTYPDGEKFTETFDRKDFENKVFKLTTLEGGAKPTSTTTVSDASTASLTPEEEAEMIRQASASSTDEDEEQYRLLIENEIEKFQPENWSKVEEFLKKNFPNVPVYRVKNVIQATNGRQAWGMFKDGAIYIYENAEVGTAYHEIFEAVWKMFTDENEQNAVLKEFRSRKGSFVDRVTGKTIAYKDANYQDAKEQLAEEFRDYVQEGKVPPKPNSGRPFILKLFYDLKNFIQEFFTGKKALSNTEKLFSNIGNGYYKNHFPYHVNLSYAKKGIIDINEAYADGDSEFSLIGISGKQRHEIIEHMTYKMLTDMIKNDDDLFRINEKLKREEVYARLKEDVQTIFAKNRAAFEKSIVDGKYTREQVKPSIDRQVALWKNVTSQWDEIVKKHEEYLKVYSIEFDENDEATIKSDERAKESGWGEANKIDSFRKASPAVKILLATMRVKKINEEGKAVPVKSSIGGYVLLPMSKVYISLMNNIHNSQGVEQMLEKIRKMAENDPNYRDLYTRLTKSSWETPGLDLKKVENENGLNLISAFWKTFKKQNPSVKNVFVLENGDVVVGDSNLSTAARQLQSEFRENLVAKIKGGTKYFKKSADGKKYVGVPDSLKKDKIGTIPEMVEFLKHFGIEFNKADILRLPNNQIERFKDAVGGIYKSIKDADEIVSISGKVLKMDGRLLDLGIVQAAIQNPEFESTFFNVNGERVQSYIGTNAVSELFDFLSQLPEFTKEAVEGTKYEYLFTDSFTKGSNILQRMFLKNGDRIKGSEELFKPGYVDGTVDESRGKRKESSKLNYRDRLIQEINLNLAGYYLNLVPGDASMEHMLYMGNAVSVNDLRYGLSLVNEIFKGYFMSELELSREGRNIVKLKLTDKQKKAGIKQRESSDMRFFKNILGKELHDEIVKAEGSIESVYEKFESKINAAIKNYVQKETKNFKGVLQSYNIISLTEDGFIADNLNLEDSKTGMDEIFLDRNLEALSINYMISNIEMHKLLYSDPYQYSDELKRIKNFNSPRQAILSNSPEINGVLNKVWNKGYKPGDIGYTDMTTDQFVSATMEDVQALVEIAGHQDLYKDAYEETDGSGIINFKSYRNFRIRASRWNSDEERQYRYDIAWEKNHKKLKLSPEEIELLKQGNPMVRSAYTTEKPIVSGNKNDGNPWNDIVLDKFAFYPLSYRVMMELDPESNSVKLYNKMQRDGVDYIVFKSGRKVGTTETNAVYNEDNTFNEAPFKGTVNIPFSIISVQSEVPSKDDELTRGSQVTKLITMDFMESGVPVDFADSKKSKKFTAKRYKEWITLSEEQKEERSPLYKEIKNNENLLKALTDEGYRNLLNDLGIVEKDGEFSIPEENRAKVSETLREEILKREVNDNIIDSLSGFLNGEVIIEATPAYQIVRNILYSIADREVISQKMVGGFKVQLPSTMLESVRAQKKTVNGKTAYTSDVLKFYEDKDGKRVCEIMVGRWFESDLSDEEILERMYEEKDGEKVLTEEGKKIMGGLAFRIPTQKQNSIDAFVIKKFLPREFGDNVIIPSGMVKKVGSDFDIDKLSIYLKNVFTNSKGELKAVPFFGINRTEARKKFDEMFDAGEFIKPEKLKELDRILEEERLALQDMSKESPSGKLMVNIFKDAFSEQEITDDFIKYMAKSTRKEVRDRIFEKMYKKSLQNAYVESGENLVSSKENFGQLIKPNSADQLRELSEKITEKLGFDSFDYSSTGNMLNRHFMSRLRHAFVTGKYAIGIAAVNQTNHSLNQRQPIYIDISRFDKLSADDKFWLTKGTMNPNDIDIKFEKYNKIEINGKMVPTLSMIKNANNEYISDIIGQFIDGYVDISKGPWIMELGASPNVAGTFLFLTKLGVPIDTVAYFMNQPIIRDYLRSLENSGYSYIFNATYVSEIKKDSKYAIDEEEDITEARFADIDQLPSETKLFENIGKTKFDISGRVEQQYILNEFLKYAKLAEQMFYVTQGSNFDTATINDPYLVFKKLMQLLKAQNTIISSVDEILKNSFLGNLAKRISDFRDAFSTILISDKPNVRNVMEKVLLPYVGLSDRDFVKVSQKAVSDMFDWAVQTNQEFNKLVREVMIDNGGVAKELFDFVTKVKETPGHPMENNHIVNVLTPMFSTKISDDGVNNIKVKGRDNKVYDQNSLIYAFRELRDYLNSINSPLYEGIKNLSVLQSGVSNSPISFTSLLPYEDFKEIYNKTLSKLETIPNLEEFYNLNIFERNNWNNDDVVPYMIARWGKSKKGKLYYNLPIKTIPKAIQSSIKNGDVPQLLNISMRTREAQNDIIVYRWEDNITKQKKKEMREKGDYSYIKKGLFKKVYDSTGNPFVYESPGKDGIVYLNYVYKMINAWGDSFRANEFYDVAKESVIDNNFLKVPNEAADEGIVDKFLSLKKKDGKIVSEEQLDLPEDEASLKEQISALEEKKKTKGLSPAEMTTLSKLQTELGKIIKSKC